jgi:hypothetical protein
LHRKRKTERTPSSLLFSVVITLLSRLAFSLGPLCFRLPQHTANDTILRDIIRCLYNFLPNKHTKLHWVALHCCGCSGWLYRILSDQISPPAEVWTTDTWRPRSSQRTLTENCPGSDYCSFPSLHGLYPITGDLTGSTPCSPVWVWRSSLAYFQPLHSPPFLVPHRDWIQNPFPSNNPKKFSLKLYISGNLTYRKWSKM